MHFFLGETERTELKYLEKQHVKQFEVYLITKYELIQYQITKCTVDYMLHSYVNYIFSVDYLSQSILWYSSHFNIFLRYFFCIIIFNLRNCLRSLMALILHRGKKKKN